MRRLSLAVAMVAVLSAGCVRSSGAGPGAVPAAADGGARASGAPVAATPIRLTVFATSDFHGALAPFEVPRPDGEPLSVGGAATLGGYLSILREENPGGVIAVDAGDLLQGTLAAGQTEGAAVIDAYAAAGYDAIVVGNHEFDHGPAGPVNVATGPDHDPTGAVAARAASAPFPFLAANVVVRATGARPGWLRPSTVVERKGLRIGIVGLSTPSTPAATAGGNVAHLAFGDPAEAAVAEARALRASGADVVLVVVHDGAVCDATGCEGPLVDLARALPPGLVDAVFGGHFHEVVETHVNRMPVLEPPPHGRGFATVDLVVDPVSRRVLAEETRAVSAHPACATVAPSGRCDAGAGPGPASPATYRGRPVAAAPAVVAAVAPHLDREAELRERPLGVRLAAPLRRSHQEEAPLGDLVADVLLARVPEADLAVTNSGGIRADLPAGPLVYGHAYSALPFENGLALLTLTGAELRELFRLGATGTAGPFQLAGATVRLRRDGAGACATADLDGDGRIGPADRDRVVSIEVGGRPLDPARRYRVATIDFLARGGDGLDRFIGRLPPERIRILSDRPLLREAVVEYLQDRGEIPPPTGGRLIVTGAEARCPPGR